MARGSTRITCPTTDATVVQRALAAGAVMVGKGHLPEFAWDVLGTNDWYGTCHNPFHPGRTTGARRPETPRPLRPTSSISASAPTPAARSGCPGRLLHLSG